MNFSIVIPLYNKERHIKRAISSIINQTYNNFEILVIDDGSTDNSYKEAIKINDSRISIIRQKNKGVSSARNKGIEKSKYDYIGFLDADDAWEPNFLSSVKNLIEQYPNSGAYATSYKIKKEDGNVLISENSKRFEMKWEGVIDDYFKYAINFPLISASSVVIPKKIFEKLGSFAVGIKRGEDLDMWCRIALNYDISYSNKICATYFYDTDNRACNREYKLSRYFSNYAEDILHTYNYVNKCSKYNYFEEYMIGKIIFKARYLINDNKRIEGRKLLYKYRYTKLNRGSLIKFYIISFLPKWLIDILLYFKRKLFL